MAESAKTIRSGQPPQTVDDYIAAFPPDKRELLEQVRLVIRQAAPDAVEKISWGMPTYHQKENLVHYAMHSGHLGFYPSPGAIEVFADDLAPYKKSKGAVQFPLSQPIPIGLIGDITRFRVSQVTSSGKA